MDKKSEKESNKKSYNKLSALDLETVKKTSVKEKTKKTFKYIVKDSEGNNIDLPSKLFNEIAPKYAGKNVGGYTRIIKVGPRRGDGAEVAVLQLI